jgi:hypothetical protein
MHNNRSPSFTSLAYEPSSPAEERCSQRDRKRVLREQVMELSRDRTIPRSPSERLKLRVASVYVTKVAVEGRRGPAAGSVLDRDLELMRLRDVHVSLAESQRDENWSDDDDLDAANESFRSAASSPEDTEEAGRGGDTEGAEVAERSPHGVDAHATNGTARHAQPSLPQTPHATTGDSTDSRRAAAECAAGSGGRSSRGLNELITPTVSRQPTSGSEHSSRGAGRTSGRTPRTPRSTLRLQAKPLIGTWRHKATTGLEPYLKHLGVGWAKRKVALAFSPEPSFAIVDGVLQMYMASPIGERLELLPIDTEVIDTDPTGKQFVKLSRWEGGDLVTTATDVRGQTADFVTRRHVARDGTMVQTTAHEGVSFERVFVRK